MPKATVSLAGFNRGLISPLALARTDLERVAFAAETMTNWMPRVFGSMMLRPGWAFIGQIVPAPGNPVKMIPFVFSTDDTALIELTESRMRIWIDDALVTRPSVATVISNGDFVSSTLTGWVDADETGARSEWIVGGYVGFIGSGTSRAIRRRQIGVAAPDQNVEHALYIIIKRGPIVLKVGSTSGGEEYIAETSLGTGEHSLSFTPTGNFWIEFSSILERQVLLDWVSIDISGPMAIGTPWNAADLSNIRYSQSGDVVFVCAEGIQQRRIERRSARSWSVVLYEPEDGPFRIPNLTATTLTPSGVKGNILLTASIPLFRTGHAGALFRITSVGQTVSKNVTAANQFTDSIKLTGVGSRHAENSSSARATALDGGYNDVGKKSKKAIVSRRFMINITGTWAGTVRLQRSFTSETGPWEDVASWTANTVGHYDDTFDNQISWYRIGIKTGEYTSGTAVMSLQYQAGSMDGYVRLTSIVSTTSANAEVLQHLGGDVSLSNLVTNGTFDTNIAGWTIGGGGTVIWSATFDGSMILLATPAADYAEQSLATSTGQTYTVEFTVPNVFGGDLSGITVTIGTSSGASDLYGPVIFGETPLQSPHIISFTATSSTSVLRFAVNVVSLQVYVDNVIVRARPAATPDWTEGEWSSYRGFPTSVSFAQGRLWWAGKDRIWASVSDAFESFDDELEGDAGPISRLLGEGPIDNVQWILGTRNVLIGSEGAEFICRASVLDEPITPTNFNIHAVSTQGSAEIEAVKIDRSGVYVQRGGTRVFEIVTDENSEYKSSDLTILIPEVTSAVIARLAIQRQPDTRIHAVRSDGKVALAVFDRGENVLCWCVLETDGIVKDVVVLPGDTGNAEDKVYYVVDRTGGQYLERVALESQCEGSTLNRQADSFIVYSGDATTTITGLSELEGKTVVVWGNGKDLGTYIVSGGQVTGISESVTSAIVGLPYTSQWKSTKLAYGAGHGATALTQRKKINQLGVILRNTHYQGLKYGRDFTTMYDLPLVEQGTATPANTVHSTYDEHSFPFPGEWDTDSRLCLQAQAPRPCNILAAVVSVETHVKD